jgi:gliding motility-associated-like protein
VPVNYTFTKPGKYYISEIIKSGSCIDTSYAVKIVVGDKLTPDFTVTPTEVCNEGKIHITGSSNNNSAVNLWHFKCNNIFDYNFTTLPDTDVTVYSDTAGYKNISLEVDYNGCFSSITKNAIFKINGPVGDFIERFTCDSQLVYHFKSKITPTTSLTWHIDTATFKDVDSVRYKFPKSGNDTVRLISIDNTSGCTLTRTKIIKVRQIKANYTINDTTLCVGDTAKLDATTSKDYINSCYNEGFLWDFGDNSPPKRTFLNTYTHIYTARGTYKLSLVTTADNGCIDSTKKTVRVYKPVGSFTTDKKFGCVPSLNVNFTNTSTDSTIVKWTWDFADGAKDSTNIKKVAHTLTSDNQKTFNSSLIVYDIHQCYSRYTIPITLVGLRSDFQANDTTICANQTVTFTPKQKGIDSLYWSFGDGSSSVETNNHTYTKTGLYTVSLTVTKSGCNAIFTKLNYISVTSPVFTISGDSVICKGESVTLKVNNETGWSIKWTPTSGLGSPTSFTTTASPSTTTMYTASVTDANSCTATRTKTVSVNELVNYTRIPAGDTTIHLGEKIQLSITVSSSNITYAWSPDYNISCLNCSNPYVAPTKNTTYKVDVKSSCAAVDETFNIKVINDFYLEAPTAFTPNGDSNNDVFKFESNEIKTFELKIFDRWGKIVFSTTDVTQGWDGTVNGHIQNIDTYTYYVKAETLYGYKFEKQGNFLLLK